MEPANIDWKNIESLYVKDEIYEHINAPKWLDLSSPDSPPVDDGAWFCRPDCKHPKTHEDFLHFSLSPSKPKKSASAVMPLGERKNNSQSLKRRGAIAPLLPLPSSPLRDPAKNKGNVNKFREDLENQDPNLVATVSTNSTAIANNPAKVMKEAIKSSAEKRGVEGELQSKKPLPRLKSTLSARNLFSGRDILGQISEFCHKIKKFTAGSERNFVATDKEVGGKEEERTDLLDSNAMEKNSASAQQAGEEEKRKVLQVSNPRDIGGSTKKNIKLTVKAEHERGNFSKVGDDKLSLLKEVRSCPPTPQRFPSPSSRCLRNTKAATSTISPLNNNKTLKSEAPVSGQRREERKALVIKEDECNGTFADASDSEGSSMDMFWFFKPCTY